MDQNIRHQAYLATLMADAIRLMQYQTEREHSASPEQTAFVVALSAAQQAARDLASKIEGRPF